MQGKKKGLTAIKVKLIKEAGLYLDTDGLFLQVTKRGSKTWIYRYMLNRKRRDMGLGSYKELTLEQARITRNDHRKLIAQGIDPIDYKKSQHTVADLENKKSEYESITFKECAKLFIEQKKAEWKNAKHHQQWENTLRDYAYPHIGNIRVGDVDRSLVLECLNPIWLTKNETATRVRQRIEAIFDYAKAMNFRQGENPAVWKGGLEPILPKPSRVKKVVHFKALDYEQMPNFMSELKAMDGLGALALQLTIMTAARTSEVLKAKQQEFDVNKKIWTIPKERMKAGIEHRVALSDTAINIIEPLLTGGDFLFLGMRKNRPLSNLAMMMVLRRMKYTDITVHGFRSTFRDWVAEQTHFPARVAETALAHQLKNNAEKAYQRGDLLEKRFQLMNAWASYCYSINAKVIRLSA